MKRSHQGSRCRAAGWALIAGALLLIPSGLAAGEERESPPSRHQPAQTRSSGGSSQPRVAVPRQPQASPSQPQTRHSPRSSTSPGRGRSGHHFRGHGFGYHGGWRFGFGFYSPYYHYGHYYYPWGWAWYPSYYPYPSYPRYARYVQEVPLGALDLNVRPKDTQVYIDGDLVGKTGKFDGFPGYLWLETGDYEVIFYRPGYATVVRRVTVRPGLIGDVEIRLEEGESLPPEQVASVRSEAPSAADADPDPSPGTTTPPPRAAAPAPEERATAGRPEVDLRGDPGRLRLDVEPQDASVYLDGRFLGTGEELGRLHAGMMVDPGGHLLEVVRPGFRTERVEFDVEAGEEEELDVELEPEHAASVPGR